MKKFASLFTGEGLADIGAMQAGYELLWGVEIDPAIASTANANLPHRDRVYAASVTDLDWSILERPDHLHISPPCQRASTANAKAGETDLDGELADACIEAIKAILPASITLENVQGYKRFRCFQRIVDALWGLGYWVIVETLNSADFGVPQSRRRLFLRAVLKGFPRPLPEPEPWACWYEAVKDLVPYLPESQFAPWQLEILPAQLRKTVLVHPTDQRTMPVVEAGNPSFTVTTNQGGNRIKAFVVDDQYNGDPDENGKRGPTLRPAGKPMFTISASQSKRSIRASVAGKVVAFDTNALGRIQTLPDWYKGATPKGIGNGVPCLMMQRVMESF